MERTVINNTGQILEVNCACLDGSGFRDVSLNKVLFENVSMQGLKITDANLSDLEIDGAQLGGAYIHNIGVPDKNHPDYDPEAVQRPMKFENCDLSRTVIDDCNLSGTEIKNCNVENVKINGIPLSDLMKAYENSRKSFKLSTGL